MLSPFSYIMLDPGHGSCVYLLLGSPENMNNTVIKIILPVRAQNLSNDFDPSNLKNVDKETEITYTLSSSLEQISINWLSGSRRNSSCSTTS